MFNASTRCKLVLRMLLVRLRSEGKLGKKISFNMVEIMWQDVEERVKLIGVSPVFKNPKEF